MSKDNPFHFSPSKHWNFKNNTAKNKETNYSSIFGVNSSMRSEYKRQQNIDSKEILTRDRDLFGASKYFGSNLIENAPEEKKEGFSLCKKCYVRFPKTITFEQHFKSCYYFNVAVPSRNSEQKLHKLIRLQESNWRRNDYKIDETQDAKKMRLMLTELQKIKQSQEQRQLFEKQEAKRRYEQLLRFHQEQQLLISTKQQSFTATNIICAICLETISYETMIEACLNFHRLHINCLRQLLQKGHKKCPQCRKSIKISLKDLK